MQVEPWKRLVLETKLVPAENNKLCDEA